MKLTDAQTKALDEITRAGVIYAYNGISRATVTVLEREGLVTVERSTASRYCYRTRRTHYIADWSARPVVR